MGTKIKGIYKSFKYITQIFVKEREMEIGYPTDVKHVAHIGWDSQSANSPSWMNEFKTASDFSASSLSNLAESRDPSYITAMSTWSSQDFEQSMAHQSASEIFKDSPSTDLPKVPKKHKRKKTGSSSSSSPWRTSRAAKSRTSFGTTAHELEITPNIQEVIP